MLLAATGTHPWSPWQEQQIIDTEHYRRVAEGLQYVAWRNNTFSLHVHVGIRGADRAVRVCDRLRPVLPELLALSANSPFLDGRDSGLHSVAHADLHQELPALRHPGRRSAAGRRTRTTWTSWCGPARSSSRPRSGGASARTTPSARWSCASATRSRARPSPRRSRRCSSACIAQAALDIDEGVPFEDPRAALRGGELLARDPLRPRRQADRPRRGVRSSRRRPWPTACWPGPPRRGQLLGIEPALPEENGAQRQRRALEQGASMEEVFAAEVAETQRTYAAEEVST